MNFENDDRNPILDRNPGESDFEYKFRLCKSKLNNEIDIDWSEICAILNLSISGESLRKRAYGYMEYDKFVHSSDSVCQRILSISDSHIPFNLPAETFRSYSGRVDILIFNGDIMDCASISSFPRLYRSDITDEMISTRKYMIDIINLIKPSQVYVNVGNHEKRLSRYLSERLNKDLLRIMPTNPLDLIIRDGFRDMDYANKTDTWYGPLREVFEKDNIDIIYSGDWFCRVGNTIFAHPLSYSSGMLKTTEKAVDHFLRKDREFTSIVLGHTHKLGSYFQGNIQMFEQGCICDLNKLDYADGKLQLPNQEGFIYLCQDNKGNVINGKTELVKL